MKRGDNYTIIAPVSAELIGGCSAGANHSLRPESNFPDESSCRSIVAAPALPTFPPTTRRESINYRAHNVGGVSRSSGSVTRASKYSIPLPSPVFQPRRFRIDTAPPPPSPLPCTRVITVRSTSSACNSRPSFPAFLLVAPAKFGRQETRRTEDVHAWNSFLIGGNRRVKTFLSSPIDRSIQYEIEFERDGKAFELLSNRHQSERSANPFNKFSSTFPRGLTERNEIEIEKEGRGAYKYWPPRN